MNKYRTKVEVLTQTGQLTHWLDFEITLDAEDHQDALDQIKRIVGGKEFRVVEMKILKPYTYKVKDN